MSKRRTTPKQRGAGAGKGGAGKGARAGKPDVQGMMAQVQRMQQDMQSAQEELANETVSASAGGGMVTVEVSGDLHVKTVTIAPEAVDPEDVEMLGDMVTAAVNEALRAAQELAAGRMGGATEGLDLGELGGLGLGGLGLPGLQ